jgi:lysophospholipase L1-like esterase
MARRRLLTTILAITALGISALAGAAPAMADDPPPTWGAPYVAIGDSVASGNGLMPYYDPACLRSKKAYPSVLAGTLGGSVVSAACSGNTTTQVAQQAATLAEQGKLGPATQLVTITAGVNDLPWILVLGACSNLGSLQQCQGAMGLLGNPAGPAAGIPAGLATAIGVVRAAAPSAHIRVTGYPFLFGSFSGTCSVGAAAPGTPMKFGKAQADLLDDTGVIGLNNAVQAGIWTYLRAFHDATGMVDQRIEYVDLTAAFATHGLCDSGDRWVSGLVSGQPRDRGFHPNASGQQAIAATIAITLPW